LLIILNFAVDFHHLVSNNVPAKRSFWENPKAPGNVTSFYFALPSQQEKGLMKNQKSHGNTLKMQYHHSRYDEQLLDKEHDSSSIG